MSTTFLDFYYENYVDSSYQKLDWMSTVNFDAYYALNCFFYNLSGIQQNTITDSLSMTSDGKNIFSSMSEDMIYNFLYKYLFWETHDVCTSDHKVNTSNSESIAIEFTPCDPEVQGFISDYYRGLDTLNILFYYGKWSTDGHDASPNNRYTIKNNIMYSSNQFDFIYNILVQKGSLYISNAGSILVYDNHKDLRFKSFSVQKNNQNEDPTITIECKINLSSLSKQRFLSQNQIYFAEFSNSFKRISVYFNIFNSTIYCHSFRKNKSLDADGKNDLYNEELNRTDLSQSYRQYCIFIDKYSFFKTQINACYCYDPNKCIALLVNDNPDSPLYNQETLKNNLYCATINCTDCKVDTILSPASDKLKQCSGDISICSNNISIDSSHFKTANINTNCSCSSCNDPKICYKNNCLLPEDVRYLEKQQNIRSIIIATSILVPFFFLMGLALLFYYIRSKKK